MKKLIGKLRFLKRHDQYREGRKISNGVFAKHNYDTAKRKENPQLAEWNNMVNSLSNYQRNHWAKFGYPGLRHKVVAEIAPFVLLTKGAVHV